MIINVRSWKYNNLEWQQQKSWFKRLLVSHIENLHPSFVHRVSVLCTFFGIKFLFVFISFYFIAWQQSQKMGQKVKDEEEPRTVQLRLR